MRYILKIIRNSITNEKIRNIVMNNVLFLRFINPVITQPNKFHGIEKIMPAQKRNLMTCGKVIQKTVGTAHFEDGELVYFNGKMLTWSRMIRELWDLIGDFSESHDVNAEDVTRIQMVNIMANIHYYIEKYEEDIKEKIEDDELTNEFENVMKELNFLGAHPTKIVNVKQKRLSTPINDELMKRMKYLDMIQKNNT